MDVTQKSCKGLCRKKFLQVLAAKENLTLKKLTEIETHWRKPKSVKLKDSLIFFRGSSKTTLSLQVMSLAWLYIRVFFVSALTLPKVLGEIELYSLRPLLVSERKLAASGIGNFHAVGIITSVPHLICELSSNPTDCTLG